MNTFIRLSDGLAMTEQDIDPLVTTPNINFNPDSSLYTKVQSADKPSVTYLQEVVAAPAALVDGVWTEQWVVQDIHADATEKAAFIASRLAVKKVEAKGKKAELIAELYAELEKFSNEDSLRVVAAQRFAAASYAGTPSVWLSTYATNKGLTTTEAANALILQEQKRHTKLKQLSALRLDDSSLDAATTEEELDASFETAKVSVITTYETDVTPDATLLAEEVAEAARLAAARVDEIATAMATHAGLASAVATKAAAMFTLNGTTLTIAAP